MIKTLKPLHGKIIPAPEYDYKPLPVEGLELLLTPYWHARINDGDVVIVTATEDITLTEKKTKKETV